MSALKKEHLPHYTYEDYVNWEGRWEIIYGIAYAMSPQPAIHHQWISSNIIWYLKELLRDCHECEALLPVDWQIANDTIVQPDNLVVCGKIDIYAAKLTKTPSLIFEIISPSTAIKDHNLKYELYEAAGVKYYCIVDPKREQAEIFELVDGKYSRAGKFSDKKFNFDLEHCKIDFDFSKIFAR